METWVTIQEYFGNNCKYQISNFGNVRSITSKGKIRYVKAVTFGSGYLGVRLPFKNKIHSVYIHRLVALYFIPNIFNKNQVNHIDGNRLNNHYTNIQWVTSKENINHSYYKGTSKVGEERHNTKYTNDQVRDIRNRYDSGMRIAEICRIFNYDKNTVYCIVKRMTYKSVI